MDTVLSESKAVRLARYLKEFVGLRSTTVYDVGKYDSALWFGEMPQEPQCQSPAWNDEFTAGDPWLTVHKQQLPKPPAPPEIVLGWIDEQALKRVASEIPSLRPTRLMPDVDAEVGEGEDPPLAETRLEDHPEVVRAYENFRPLWEAWSKEYQRCSRIQSVYAELFRLHTQLQKQGEIVELVLGLGLLVWPRVGGKLVSVRRHVVTARVDLHFDPATGIMQLDGAAEGAQLRIEDDMLDAEVRPDRRHYASVGEQLSAIGDDVWDRASIFTALKSWASALHPDSEWSTDLKPPTGGGEKPAVIFAPALILRKRAQVGMVRIYDALIERMSENSEGVPPGWSGLIDDADDHEVGEPPGLPGESPRHVSLDTQEIYFPLPANREQRRIVQAISERRGVLVQGPPGTGKSHTIANLVCHLLAAGKRVLITAETGRALKVLKEKLPEDIQPLCVSLLGQGGDAFSELNASVQGITTRFAAWSPGAHDDRIAEIDRELDASRRSLAKIDTELRSFREEETYRQTLGAYTGSASAIAQRVAIERARFGWLQLTREAADNAPVTRADMAGWLSVRRRYDEDVIASSALRIVGTERLPSPEDFGGAVTSEREAKEALERLCVLRGHRAYKPIVALDRAERARLAEALQELSERRKRLLRVSHEWLRSALVGALGGRQARWQALLDESHELLRAADQLVERVAMSSVSIPEGRDPKTVRGDAAAVIAHLDSGGRWSSFGLLTPRAVRERLYLRDEVRVDGQPADTVERLQVVCHHLDLAFSFEGMELAWSDYGGLPGGTQPRMRLAEIKEHVGSLGDALGYAMQCLDLGRRLSAVSPAIPEPDWIDDQAEEWLELIEASAFEERHQVAVAQTTGCLRQLMEVADLHDAQPVVRTLIRAVESRDVRAYSEAHEQVRLIEQTRRDQKFRGAVEAELQTKVPGLTDVVVLTLSDAAWDGRFKEWEDAWRWAVADNWLRKRDDVGYRDQLWQRRRDTDVGIRDLLAESAALRAWSHFFNRLSHPEAAALKSWREAVRAMGKATGRSARLERLRREARQYMDQCRDAIPVWIMPRYLVAEMIDPKPGRYDLVIVDEASQLGIESLFLFYVSKKMVVVGDDQQISPYGVGISDEAIADLQHHYLDGVPHRHALSAQSSLYANAKIRFGQNIVLREHFRCMPEIIQFSNDLCYANNGTPLDPLRAYPANRLRPLVVRHLPEGYRTGTSQNALNEPEAEALVAQVIGCINDPRYVGRTMGVISLQGEAQAKLIENKLLERLEPEIIEERRLICGDAYAFQGDERDVIFLSMVAAPGEIRIGALSNESARQRFNVAASRARDQLWLFHSATLDVLSPSCMRHRLLSYMLNPGRQTTEDRTHRFDSQFERDVFEVVSGKGFHVRTQVCVGDPTNHRYRIDLVVEGMQGRLAVECDGDEWHGPERYEQDMARQRDLERAGWQFVRIRGGNFYRDRVKATAALWDELEELGIKPGGIDEAAAEPPPPADSRTIDREVDEEIPVEPARTQGRDMSDEESSAGTRDEVVRQEPKGADAADTWGASASPEDQVSREDAVRELVEPADAIVRASNRLLADYVCYPGMAGPHPRSVSASVVGDGLCRIIEAEGPMLAKRAYDIYLRGCGIRRLGGELKTAMNKALAAAIQQGRVVSENEAGKTGLIFSTVRSKGSPPVKLRCRGPRTFEEIPPGELRAAGRRLSETLRLESGSDEHLRAILELFDLKRLTTQVGTRLLETLDEPEQIGAPLLKLVASD
jgi:very-short-patch-repair endonuclease